VLALLLPGGSQGLFEIQCWNDLRQGQGRIFPGESFFYSSPHILLLTADTDWISQRQLCDCGRDLARIIGMCRYCGGAKGFGKAVERQAFLPRIKQQLGGIDFSEAREEAKDVSAVILAQLG
jgi:hypothetical protein